MIRLRAVTKIYPASGTGSVLAVGDLNLSIECGEFVVITGRSGSGKTTVLNLIAGLVRPTAGTVELEGVDLWRLPDGQQSALRNHKLGFVFQFPSLVPSLTVLENVMLPTIFKPKADPMEAEDSALELLNLVRLADRLNAFPRELSAGQQQRVVIARSLINQPAILLADEPTSNLDAATEQEIMALLEGIHRRRAITVVMVTHTRQLATRSARILEMAEGRLIHNSST